MREQKFWSLVLYISLAVGLLWVLLGVFNVILASSIFEDDFNAYELGNLVGQGGWTEFYPRGGLVIDDPVLEGARAVDMCGQEPGVSASSYKIGNPLSIGTTYFHLKLSEYNPDNYGMIQLNSHEFGLVIVINFDVVPDNEILWRYYDGGWIEIKTTPFTDEWIEMAIDWNSVTHQFKVFIIDTWTELFNSEALNVDIDKFVFDHICYGNTTTYLDFISEEELAPPPEKVWAVSPASGTEITSVASTFEFGWEGLEDWDNLLVVFQNRPTGIFSQAKTYDLTSVTSTIELTFEDFNFDRNGKFYFYAVASKLEMEIIEGMFLTGGYSYDWTSDLVDPEHWFTINIEGLVSIFEMSDYETWYGEVSKFTTSTAMFVSIAGFFDPIFNYIGEFGNRIKNYFNLNEAYSQGYEIGKTIPYFTFFVAQVSLFLGGFPILKWVFVVILLLVGIFIFRLILKFIPGLG